MFIIGGALPINFTRYNILPINIVYSYDTIASNWSSYNTTGNAFPADRFAHAAAPSIYLLLIYIYIYYYFLEKKNTLGKLIYSMPITSF